MRYWEREGMIVRRLLVAACLTLWVSGCLSAPAPDPDLSSAASYFPYQPGTRLHYEGKGNEYASYTVTVLYRERDRLEWRRDNGGTVLAEVYRITPREVTLVYREGEAYDQEKRLARPANADQVVLQAPVAPGTTWTSGGATFTIRSVSETVAAAGTVLTGVVAVEVKQPAATVRQYYHRRFGLVLSVFESEGTVVESRLQAVTGP